MNDNVKIILGVVAVFGGGLIILGSLTFFISPGRCAATWEGVYETKWDAWTGCRVKIGGHWIPDKNVRFVPALAEGEEG